MTSSWNSSNTFAPKNLLSQILHNLHTSTRDPDLLLAQILHNIQSLHNDTVDFRRPHLRRALVDVYPIFLVMYFLLVVFGGVANVAMIYHVLRRRLFRDPTCAYYMNLGVCNVIMCFGVLPVSLAILLIQNWVFGSFLCYFLPMLQDVPINAAMASFVVMAFDRFRFIRSPLQKRMPPFLVVLALWVVSVCVVLPYAVYVNYIDLELILGPPFSGVGICTVNLAGDIASYVRGLFIALYVLPLVAIFCLHVRVSTLLKNLEEPVVEDRRRRSSQTQWSSGETQPRLSTSAILTELEASDMLSLQDLHHLPSFLTPTPLIGGGTVTPTLPPFEDNEMNVTREKRNHRYVVTCVTVFALCLCPLMILRLVKNMVIETNKDSGHFDMTYITFVWVAFLPSLSTPLIYGIWKISSPTKERLQAYFRLKPRGRPHAAHTNYTPTFSSNHARTAHRLSLEPTIPTTPTISLAAVSTPTMSSDRPKPPNTLALSPAKP